MKDMYSLRSSILLTQSLRTARDQWSSGVCLSSRKAAWSRSRFVQISFFWRQSKLLHCSPDLAERPAFSLTNSAILRKQPLGFQYSQLILEQGNWVAQWKGNRKNLFLWPSENFASGSQTFFFRSLRYLAMDLTGCDPGVSSSLLTPYKTGIAEYSSHSSKMDSLSSQALVYASFFADLACFFTILRKLFKIRLQLSNIRCQFKKGP